MATALDIITDALIRDGIYAPGDSITDADAERCLSILNDMLDSWSNESLTCYAIAQQNGLLIPGQYQYTIGTSGGANFAITRPIRLIDGPGAAYMEDTNGNRYALSVVPLDQWNLISNVTDLVTSNFPSTLFYDPQYPLGILNFNPVPNIGYTAYWTSYLQLTDFSALNSTVSLPPGYKDALQKCLAVEIWPDFKPDGSNPSQVILDLASKAKGNVKRSNIRENVAVYDPELITHAVGTYNVYIDGFPRQG